MFINLQCDLIFAKADLARITSASSNRKSSQRHDCGLVWTSHPLGASVLTPVLHKKGIYKDEWLPLWGHPSTLFKTRLCMFSQEWNRGRCSLLLVWRQDCLSKYFNCLSVYWNCIFWYILAAATTESSHSDILPLNKIIHYQKAVSNPNVSFADIYCCHVCVRRADVVFCRSCM